MALSIPRTMREEHEELHHELKKVTRMRGAVGKTAQHVAEVLHPHFEKENELALPIVSIMRQLAEGKSSKDYSKAAQLFDRFEPEYRSMLGEHVEIVAALEELEEEAWKAKNMKALQFARKLKAHAKAEEDLTYPAILIAGKLLKQL